MLFPFSSNASLHSCKSHLANPSVEINRAIYNLSKSPKLEGVRKFIESLRPTPLNRLFFDLIIETTTGLKRGRKAEIAKQIVFGNFEGTPELAELFRKTVKALKQLQNEMPFREQDEFYYQSGAIPWGKKLNSFRILADTIEALIVSASEKQIQKEIKGTSEKTQQLYRNHWAASFTGVGMSSPLNVVVRLTQEISKTKSQIFIDVGSCHGVPDIVLAALRPNLQIVGLELVESKVNAANRVARSLGLDNVRFLTQDLASPKFRLPKADFYYFYNPTHIEVMAKSAKEVVGNCTSCKVIVVKGGMLGYDRPTKAFEALGYRSLDQMADGYTILRP